MKIANKEQYWACAILAAASLAAVATTATAQTIELKAQAYSNDQPLPFGEPTKPSKVIPIAVAPSASPADAKSSRWELTQPDGTLSRGLMRWAREAKVQLVYEAPSDLAAVTVAYTGDFWTALEGVLADTANGSYPLHGCRYTNVVRILHTSQACDR
ncbi:Toxin co-regulated pilus biosynthesis protein Q [Hydrogenophaga sp. T4]|jgi:hypothetical protein|nr:Toxin co-regulated pilus biosynthesis protein Q [Hydrogenophaga sp. T4]